MKSPENFAPPTESHAKVLSVAVTGHLPLDFAMRPAAMLDFKRSTDPTNGIADFIDLTRSTGRDLAQSGWQADS